MGLFTGMSILSMFEVAYWLLVLILKVFDDNLAKALEEENTDRDSDKMVQLKRMQKKSFHQPFSLPAF